MNENLNFFGENYSICHNCNKEVLELFLLKDFWDECEILIQSGVEQEKLVSLLKEKLKELEFSVITTKIRVILSLNSYTQLKEFL